LLKALGGSSAIDFIKSYLTNHGQFSTLKAKVF
jgi:hypothetical protein